jgi:hypothetical protein
MLQSMQTKIGHTRYVLAWGVNAKDGASFFWMVRATGYLSCIEHYFNFSAISY